MGAIDGVESCGRGDDDIAVIALANSPTLTKLQHLDLSDNDLFFTGAVALANSPTLTKLQHLDLSENKIHDAGVIALANSPTLTKLQVLNLEGNNIGATGLIAIANSPTLKELQKARLKAEANRKAAEQLRLKETPDYRILSDSLNPEGWKLVNSSQKDAKPAILKKNPRGVELLGDNYTFYHDLPDLTKFDQVTFLFSVELRSTNPGVYLQYWDGGKNPVNSVPYASKKGEWETLNVEFTVDGRAKFHRLYSAILGAVKNNPNPSVDIRNIKLVPKYL